MSNKIELTTNQFYFLMSLSRDLANQDSSCVEVPVYVVYEKREMIVDENFNHDAVLRYRDDEDFHRDLLTQEEYLHEIEKEARHEAEFTEIWIKEYDSFVGAYFSQGAAEAFIKRNKHNLNKAYVHIDSAYDNCEFRELRNIIAGFLGGAHE